MIMTDGKSLEHTGVTPDEILLPTAADVANNRDPVLSRAAALLGVVLSPEDAGKLFPFVWERPVIPKIQRLGWNDVPDYHPSDDPMPRWHPGWDSGPW